jgi:hypothetical protein
MRTTTLLALAVVLTIGVALAQPGHCCGAAGHKSSRTALIVSVVSGAAAKAPVRGLSKVMAASAGTAGAEATSVNPCLAIVAAYKNPPLPVWVAPMFESYVGHTRPGIALAGRF